MLIETCGDTAAKPIPQCLKRLINFYSTEDVPHAQDRTHCVCTGGLIYITHIKEFNVTALNKFVVYTSAPHPTFMAPFYAFITLDTPDSAKRVLAPLSASFRNI